MTKWVPSPPGVIFKADSPFLRLPHSLDETQRRFFEALRFGIEMAQASSRRLRENLSAMSLQKGSKIDSHPEAVATAFLDAWSLVDSIHRLRELLASMPRLKKGAILRVFYKESEPVEGLRNRVQHLKGDLLNTKLSHLPVWGTLSWIWLVDRTHVKVVSGSLTAGADTGRSARPFPIPADRMFHDVLDHISLSVGANSINLSEVMRLTIRIARILEQQMQSQFEGLEALPLVDALVLLDIELSAPVRIARPPANAEPVEKN